MKKILLLYFILYYASVEAQITVSNSAPYNSASYMVQNLFLGTGITTSNITFSGNLSQMGFFNGINCNIGLDSGIILSTGGIGGVLGPNDDFGQSAGFGGPGDPDLTALTGDATYDAAILEFDFIPIGDTVRFRYVFASEEYPEYVYSFNDVFALFISGPGIISQKNLALIPGTLTPITINNVNELVNSAYYVDNGDGNTWPYYSQPYYVQFDGFTVVLQAESVVQCGQPYHLKIAIADVLDVFYDSAVFLEAGSFAGNTININVMPPNAIGGITGEADTALFEGCGPVILTFVRNGNLSQQATYNISYSGTAQMNSDYSSLPSTVTFPSGTDTVFLSFNPINDGVSESIETLIIQMSGVSSCFSLIASLSVSDAPPLQIVSDSISVCATDSILISVQAYNGISPYQYLWNTGDSDSAIYIDPSLLTDYYVTVTDGCGMQASTATISAVPGFFFNASAGICPGDSIQLGGNWQNTDGIYYDSLLSINGCDSIIETILTINPVSGIQYQVSICNGDSIFLQGNFQTISGAYYDTLTSSNGCDSVLATTLTVNPIVPASAETNICLGDSILLQNAYQTTTGIYYDTLISSNGCDSVIETMLTINPLSGIQNQASICYGDSILLQNIYQTTVGTYYDTLSAVNGCDSVIATTLIINPITVTVNAASICFGDSVFLQHNYQTSSGNYYDTVPSEMSCDSVIITNLFIKPAPIVSAGNDTTIEEGTTIQLNALGGTIFIWSPSGELSCSQCPSPSVTPSQEVTTYYVTVTGTNGCSNIDSVTVFVEFISEFLVPNIITPNGDGLNDKFYFQGINIEEIEGKIFNRWGQLIFEWNGTDTFFEGKNMDGEAVSEGVYFFLIKAKDTKKREYNREGTVTVLR